MIVLGERKKSADLFPLPQMKRLRRGLGDGHLYGVVLDAVSVVSISAASFQEKEAKNALDRVEKRLRARQIISLSSLCDELGGVLAGAVQTTAKKLLSLGVERGERDLASQKLRRVLVSSLTDEVHASWEPRRCSVEELLADEGAQLRATLDGVPRDWVATVERCFAVHTLLEHVKMGGQGGGKKGGKRRRVAIEDRWNQEMERRNVVLQYRQACRYAQLAKLLARFPRFMYQRELTTLEHWMEPVECVADGKMASLARWLSMNMTAGHETFWSVNPRHIRVARGQERLGFALHRDGFQVWPQALRVGEDVAGAVAAAASGRAHRIFNDAGLGEEDDDGQRRQYPVERLFRGCPELKDVWARLTAWIGGRCPQHRVSDPVVLISLDGGCLPQRAHTDYTEQSLHSVDLRAQPERVPLACLVALQDDTSFDVWPGAIAFNEDGDPMEHCTVILQRGDVLLFRGDLVHAGAAFGRQNVRLHAYLDVEGVQREPDQTFYMDIKEHVLPRGQRQV